MRGMTYDTTQRRSQQDMEDEVVKMRKSLDEAADLRKKEKKSFEAPNMFRTLSSLQCNPHDT